jgi:hypothetical protein
MDKAGRPYDWKRVRSLKQARAKAVSWKRLRAAVAYRVIYRYFKNKSKYFVAYNSELNSVGDGQNFVNKMVADNMADQILMLGGFEDDRIRRKLGKDEE